MKAIIIAEVPLTATELLATKLGLSPEVVDSIMLNGHT